MKKRNSSNRNSGISKLFRIRGIIALLVGILVAFTTTYTLILPAITVDLETADEMNGLVLEDPASMGTAEPPEQAASETPETTPETTTEPVYTDPETSAAEDTYTVAEESTADQAPAEGTGDYTDTSSEGQISEVPAANGPAENGQGTGSGIETDLPDADPETPEQNSEPQNSYDGIDAENPETSNEVPDASDSSADTTTDPGETGTDTEGETVTPADGTNTEGETSSADNLNGDETTEPAGSEETNSGEDDSQTESNTGDEPSGEETTDAEGSAEDDPDKDDSEEESKEEESTEEESSEEEKPPVTSPLTYHCDYYDLEVSFDPAVQLPAGTRLEVRELYKENLPYYEDLEYEDLLIYQKYYELSEKEMEKLRVKEFSTAVLYELSFVDEEGEDVLLPYIDYDIQVKYQNVTVTHTEDVIRAALYTYDVSLNEYRADLFEKNSNEGETPVITTDAYDLLQKIDLEKVSFDTYDMVLGLFAGKEEELSEMTFEAVLDNVAVNVLAPAGAFPEGTTMQVIPVEEEAVLNAVQNAVESQVKSVTAVDITFYDAEGSEIQPEKEIQVSLRPNLLQVPEEPVLVHVDHEGEANVVEDVTHEEEGLSFESKDFSVYALVYTVDFEYEIDGQIYTFSIPGGGFVSLNHLVEVLGIAADAVNNAAGTDSGAEADPVYDSAIDLNNTVVSDTAVKFAAEIADVSFSSPQFVWGGKAETDTSIGALKEIYALNVQYSSELTADEIAAINAQTVSAGDWVLISLLPFTSEETLTVTMKNGDQFVVKVTDFHEITDSSSGAIDVNKSYIISCTELNSTGGVLNYHVLKTDGTMVTYPANTNLDKLDSEYRWTFNYVFEEKDRPDSLTYTYYLIRPIDNKGRTIALNAAGEELIQSANNNVAVVPQEDGGFKFIGYNNIELNYTAGVFSGQENGGSVIRIYEMETLPKYDYTVRSADETMGSVTVSDGTLVTETHEDAADTHYYTVESTESDSTTGKYNAGTITATPVNHTNNGQNKWVFDYWDMNGTKLEGVGATITPEEANRQEIPFNGSQLTAHFKVNPSYVFPDSEKQGSSFEDMTVWLNNLLNQELPLNKDGCSKTAEVYDYENRIYRVDLTAQSNMTTFDGTIDLGFILDVSNSMYFPSNLQPVSGLSNVDIRAVNWDYWNGESWVAQNCPLTQGTVYYLISDENNTSTVYRIEYVYEDGYWAWRYRDASKTAWEGHIDGNTVFKANNPGNTSHDNNFTYQMYYDADLGHNRFYYLNQSLTNTTSALFRILNKLTIASTGNPSVNVAYNTFNAYLNTAAGEDPRSDHSTPANQSQDFATVTPIQATFNYAAGGGTRPDRALEDATNNWHWSTGSVNRYAILITDGAPQGHRTDIDNENYYTTQEIITNKVIPAANALKAKGVKLITIGLSIDNVDGGRILLYDLADDIDGKHMFFSAETGSDLESILLQIVRTIMEDATVTGQVTDTIGDAFYPVDKATGMPLTNGNKIDLLGNKLPDDYSGSDPYGVIQEDGKTIIWTNQEFTHDGWHGTVYVKAKEDLLGGNAVQTNSGNALIEAQGYKLPNSTTPTPFDTTQTNKLKTLTIGGEDSSDLQSPRVNINELSFNGNDTEWTVYLGTQVDPKEQLKKLWNEILVEEVVKEGQAVDTDNDGLPDTGADSNDNNWYLLMESIEDNREEGVTGEKQTFKMNDLIKVLAADKSYDWWDYPNNEPKWDVFLTQALTENGIVIPYDEYSLNDNSSITIKLTKEILTGEESDLVNKSPHTTTVVNDTDNEGNAVPVEKYSLTVRYSPDYDVVPVGQGGGGHLDYHTGIYGTSYQGHAAGTETSRNTHLINVYAKTLLVEKLKRISSESGSDNPAGDDQAEPVTTARLTDKNATFSIYRKWKTGDGTDKQVSLEGYTLNGSVLGPPASDADYYYLIEEQETDQGLAKFTIGLSAADTPYYLAETTTPEGYLPNKVLQTIQIVTGPDNKTDLSGTDTTAMPYNWTQGVRFYLDDKTTPAVYVDANNTAVELKTGDVTRDYVLPSDVDGYYQTEVVNEPLAGLQLKKQVTINDFDPAHSTVTDKTVADGTYVIQIAGKAGTATEGKSYTVKITITNGSAASATISDNTAEQPADTPATLTNGVLELPNLIPGEYTITEDVDSKTVLSAINSNDDTAVADLENRKITIVLDGTDSTVQMVTLTNNYADNSETDIAHISVRKTFEGLKPGDKLPEGFQIKVKVTATIDGTSQEFNYTLTGATDTEHGVIWNQSVNADGDVVWDWKIAIRGMNPDAQVKIEEINYTKPGYDVTTTVNPADTGGTGTSYTGTVSASTTVASTEPSVITAQNTLTFPLSDTGTAAKIFVARIVPSQTSLVISEKKLNLSERAALEAQLQHMPNAQDWYRNTTPLYYSFEEAAANQIIVRNHSTVTYNKEQNQIVFDKKCQWNMVATVDIVYQEGRPADFNFKNSYTERSVGIDIVKVDKNNRTATLPGAVFTLTKLDETTTPGHIVYKKVTGSDTYEKQETSAPTGANGEISFSNLKSGYYEIKETELPDGYILNGDGCIYVKIADGVASYLAVAADTTKPITEWETITETSNSDLVQITMGRADDPATPNINETKNTEFSVGNEPGVALPSTGGPGTWLFYLLGGLLAGASGILFLLRYLRRMG